ncbi:MAG: hypothetical protein HFACDABA_02532 [Anaerolineales bacterium]|nr:hypothetical protein [Anaerolineales bacterium]
MNTPSFDLPIARGRTAEVFAWDEQHILKLFHDWFSLEDIEYEFKIAKAVHASGVKSPAVKEIVQVNGRNGLVYERIHGETMFALLKRRPWRVFHLGTLLAQYHFQMHTCNFDAEVPVLKDKLRNRLKRAKALLGPIQPRLLDALGPLSAGNKVCHGDFHPGNILLANDSAMVIDWIDASRGNPLADVARTSVLALGAASTFGSGMKLFIKLFHAAYLKEYFRLSPAGKEEYRKWIPIVAGARLDENIPELKTWLLEQARA